jgi:hypothetical protein
LAWALFDRDRLAHALGPWRALATIGAGALAFVLGWLWIIVLDTARTLGFTSASEALVYGPGLALFLASLLLWVWSIWQLFRDHVHGDHRLAAQRYRNRSAPRR